MATRRPFTKRHRLAGSSRPHSAAQFGLPYELYGDQSSQEPSDQLNTGAGSVGAGSIIPGAISQYHFDSGIVAPVLWQTGVNPVLPDPLYPVGTLLFNTVDDVLYRNVDDLVWSDSVAATTITGTLVAGQIGAGQIQTSHLQTGQITLYDENGVSVLTPAGWAGSWSDWSSLGLYNGQLRGSATGAIANGRTSGVGAMFPYWTVSRTGSSVLTRAVDTGYASGYRLRVTFSATGETLTLKSDAVGVIGGQWYATLAVGSVMSNGTGNVVKVETFIDWYKADGTFLSSTASTYKTAAHVAAQTVRPEDAVEGSSYTNASYAQVRVVATHVSGSVTGTYVDLGAVGIQAAASALNFYGTYDTSILTVDASLRVGTAAQFVVDYTGTITDYAGVTDYTPTITNGGTATWTTRIGSYFKIGNMVFVTIELQVATVGTGGGNIEVALPSTVGSRNMIMNGHGGGFTTFSSGTVSGLVNASGSTIVGIRDSGNLTLSRAHFVIGGWIRLTGWYMEA